MKHLKLFESFKSSSCWRGAEGSAWYEDVKDIVKDRLQELDDMGCHIAINYSLLYSISVKIDKPSNSHYRDNRTPFNSEAENLKDISLDEIYDNLSAMISELKEKNITLTNCVLYDYVQQPLVIDLSIDHFHNFHHLKFHCLANELPPLKTLKIMLTPLKFTSIFKPLRKNIKGIRLDFDIKVSYPKSGGIEPHE